MAFANTDKILYTFWFLNNGKLYLLERLFSSLFLNYDLRSWYKRIWFLQGENRNIERDEFRICLTLSKNQRP